MDDNTSSTLSITIRDKKEKSRQSSGEQRVFTDVTAYCQLMLEAGGALFEFPLSPKTSPVNVGRDSQQTDSKLNIDLSPFNAHDMGVSRIHARFERSGTRLFVRDLNSTNGTWVNGKRLTPMHVNEVLHGDQIEFGRLSAKLYVKS